MWNNTRNLAALFAIEIFSVQSLKKTYWRCLAKIAYYNCCTGCLTDQRVWFPGVSGKHFDENSLELEVFATVNFNLNEKACCDWQAPSDAYDTQCHPTINTITVTVKYETVYSCKLPN